MLEDEEGFQVVGEAGDGEQAIEMAGRLRPDLVLLDMSMPRMDGLEALPHILAASPKSRVVVFSGFSHEKLAATALSLGAASYLEKGATPEDIVGTLRRAATGGGASA